MNFENIFTQYKARKLTEADVPDILGLYLENAEYFKYCPPRPSRETVKEDMVVLPPAKRRQTNILSVFLTVIFLLLSWI